MLDLSYIDQLAKPLLDFFNTSHITDFATLAVTAALLLTAVDFRKQKKEFPARKMIGLLAIFFFCDGIDYAVYLIAEANKSSFFDLLGTFSDIAVALSAMVVMFNSKPVSRDKKDECPMDHLKDDSLEK